MLFTVFVRSLDLSLSWARWIQSRYSRLLLGSIHFPPSALRCSKWSLFFRFPHWNLLFIFLLFLHWPHALSIAHSFGGLFGEKYQSFNSQFSFFLLHHHCFNFSLTGTISYGKKRRWINNIKVGPEGKGYVDVKWTVIVCNLPGTSNGLLWKRRQAVVFRWI